MDARTNQLTASFPTETAKHVFCEFAAASDACYNSINYRRQQAYFTDGENVWEAPVRELRDEYVPIIGSGTFDQIERKNADAWESFFELLEDYHDPENQSVTEKPSVPGYWGSRSEGYPLRTLIRNDLYEFEWGEDGSTVEFTIGQALKETYGYGHYERLRLDVHGDTRWTGKDGQLELCYDEDFDVIRVNHTVRQPALRTGGHSYTQTGHTNRLESSSDARFAAIDLGANNTITAVTSAGEAVVCNARSEFQRFRSLSERIATLQSQLATDSYSSRQIRRTFARRGNRRDHHLDATVRLVAEWLHETGVEHVVVGDLTNVLSTHWNARVNEKTHAFWSHGGLIDRIEVTFEEIGVDWSEESETGSSSTCPACGSEHVERDGDSFDCLDCGYRGHSDVVGATNLLVEHTDASALEIGLMAQPAGHDAERSWRGDLQVTHLKWDDHAWIPTHTSERERADHSTNEASANPQVHPAR
ncbi:transposase [Salinarchaeum laminariae]|uniref:transposase n=1 Tax=Salinarchaeum laminariae TaxID=869888 RepID=UPI0020BEDAB2|nr:transposase [Salinarchaeum laminariae]